jgi:lipoprotein LprG
LQTIRRLVPVIALAIIAAACSNGSDDGPTTTAAPPVTIAADVDAILAASAEAMGNIESVHFTIGRGGALVAIDAAGSLVFDFAEGRYGTPGAADALVTIDVNDIKIRVGAIAIEGSTYLTNPITGRWEPVPDAYEFDPAALFDPEVGWRPLLASGYTDVTLLGTEDREGVATYHLTGTAEEERVEAITAGLVTNQDVELELWIDVATGEVREVTFAATSTNGQSFWTLTFFDYGADITIEPPDLS